MKDVLIGLVAIVVGAMFCYRGYLAMRLIIPIWGAFAGFALGAGIVDAITGDGFLVGVAGWVTGVAIAVLFAGLAYLYYEVSVLIGMAAIGFVLGSSVMVALGVTWSWVIIIVGVAVGTLLAALAIIADLPMVLLTVLTAAAGASTVVTGLMLLTNTLSTGDLSTVTPETIDDGWWWYATYGVLMLTGIVAQIRVIESMTASVRSAWGHDGGRQLSTSQGPA
ncbi:MAG: DUF4203 domain-containing protein [Ilumatobacteraceae bacterium]|jgi:hypothetical protein